jgi:hypothetical protein
MPKGKSCVGKARYNTPIGGKIAARKARERHNDVFLVSYKCQKCGGYHVGHPRRSVQLRVGVPRLIELIEKAVRQDESRKIAC